MPGKSSINTHTPRNNILIEIEMAKQLKKLQQERKQKITMKRALNLTLDSNKDIKPKKRKTLETDIEDATKISLSESYCCPFEELKTEFQL